MCPAGTFCPAGSSFPIPCTPGKYCAFPEMSAESGLCDAGFFCIGGSSFPNPQNGEMGGLCPPGHFCGAGTSSPSPCPPGTYLPSPGAQSPHDCLPCTAGFYCSQWGNKLPDAECSEGWYCPLGTVYPQSPDYLCPIGHYCPSGSPEPKICTAGHYQDKMGQSQCQICPPGKFCGLVLLARETLDNVSANAHMPRECPLGYYCVEGTMYGLQNPCPTGTFSKKTGLISIEGCSPCPGGWFCSQPGTVTM
ncbi:hypothetical protein AB205_0130870, partial [Aquarana catesbeiana]